MPFVIKKRRNVKMSSDSQVDQELIDRGEGSSEAVEAISQQELLERVDQLNREFQEFEKIREGISTKIASITALVPRLNESKHLLQKEIVENRNVVQQLDSQVPALNQQEKLLLQSVSQKQEGKARLEQQIRLEQDKIKEIRKQITQLTRERKKAEKITQQKQDEMSKIDEQIKQIKSVQGHSVDFASTLVYTSQKKIKQSNHQQPSYRSY